MCIKSIVIAGKNNIATEVCRYILRAHPDLDLCVVPNKTDSGSSTFQESLLEFARANALSVITLREAALKPSAVFLSLEFDQIIDVDQFASREIFNIHFSLLPEYKGMYTSALPILHGAKSTGVTLHEIDRGIDTGDIVDQVEFPLSSFYSASDLYAEYTKYGIELVCRNLESILGGRYKTHAQGASGSTYYDRFSINYSELSLDLKATAQQVLRQVNAFTFRYYQLLSFQGHALSNAVISDNKSSCKHGTIISESDYELLVSTIDYDVRLFKDKLQQLFGWIKVADVAKIREYARINPAINNLRSEQGWSPIIVAAYHGSLKVIELLLEFGASVNDTNYRGTTVLMYAKDYAIRSGDFEFFKSVIALGADSSVRDIRKMRLEDYLDKNDSSHRQIRHILENSRGHNG